MESMRGRVKKQYPRSYHVKETDKQYRAIVKQAKKERRNIADLVRDAIGDYLTK